MAPEIILREGHNKDCDLWAIGILLFELLTGYTPFRECKSNNLKAISKNIIENQPLYPYCVSAKAKDLIKNLLRNDPQERLGSQNYEDLKNHVYFEGLNWNKIIAKNVDGPLLKIMKNKEQKMNDLTLKAPIKKCESSDDGSFVDLMGITYNQDEKLYRN